MMPNRPFHHQPSYHAGGRVVTPRIRTQWAVADRQIMGNTAYATPMAIPLFSRAQTVLHEKRHYPAETCQVHQW
jgi:hypothetical protein